MKKKIFGLPFQISKSVTLVFVTKDLKIYLNLARILKCGSRNSTVLYFCSVPVRNATLPSRYGVLGYKFPVESFFLNAPVISIFYRKLSETIHNIEAYKLYPRYGRVR